MKISRNWGFVSKIAKFGVRKWPKIAILKGWQAFLRGDTPIFGKFRRFWYNKVALDKKFLESNEKVTSVWKKSLFGPLKNPTSWNFANIDKRRSLYYTNFSWRNRKSHFQIGLVSEKIAKTWVFGQKWRKMAILTRLEGFLGAENLIFVKFRQNWYNKVVSEFHFYQPN